LPRRRDSCPYKEELFKRPDWATYRNELQKWQKEYKLLPIPKIISPLQKYHFLNDMAFEIEEKQEKAIYIEDIKKDYKKKQKNIFATNLDETGKYNRFKLIVLNIKTI